MSRGRSQRSSRREIVRRAAVGIAVTTALAAGFIAWRATLLGEYSVMDMGGGNADAGTSSALQGVMPATVSMQVRPRRRGPSV